MELIGIDIGFSATRRTSGVARLAGSDLVYGRATSDWKSRVEILGDRIAEVVAIDGPLLRHPDCPKRVCETIFASGLFGCRCKPGFSHVPGTGLRFRGAGEQTAKQLASLSRGHDISCPFPRVWPARNLVEAFPNSFLGVLIPDSRFERMPRLRRGKKFDWLYEECRDSMAFHSIVDGIGAEMLPGVLAAIEANRDHEERAALVCLLTAAGAAAGRYTAVGDDKGGYFFLPSWNLWEQWAQQELDRRRKRIEMVDVWINGERFSTSDKLSATA